MNRTSLPKPYFSLIHIILWLIFFQILFDLGGLYYAFQELAFENSRKIDDAFLHMPLMVVFFYINSQWLIPRFLNKKDWWKYLLSIILMYVFIIEIGGLIFNGIESQGWKFRVDEQEFFEMSLGLYLFTLLGSLSWGIAKIAFEKSANVQLARQEQQEAELKFLVAQFNPHFLFNTLNSLYFLATTENAHQTTEAILKLSEMMRYPIKKGMEKKVLVSEEITFLENYIALQKLRLGDDYPIIFQKNNTKEEKIMPLAFMPLVENAFKYGVSQKEKSPIQLEVKMENHQLYFSTKNKVVQEKNIPSFKIGVDNLKARLDIVYGNEYSLEVEEHEGQYGVELRIFI